MNILLHPTYFPNIATFIAIAKADKIVFEVNDNYQKQTYRNRSYIYAANGKLQLSIPVIFTQKNRQKYKDVCIANDYKWQDLHWKSLESAYRTSPFFEFYCDELEPLFKTPFNSILEFNLKCFETICEFLQIDTSIETTVIYEKEPKNSIDYRFLVNAKKETPIAVEPYTQVFNTKHGFINNLSILDLLFNEGTNALNYLQSQDLP
ncbi:WbqC family protein [uncultured Lacinutrix sp.]|uniref:WbqC family protein n=1 Tax=uncultured Lacinutrix sp. TaxID=574032 RepID=UPI002619C9CE|nr:WbqC family protein [uncultured Lacinutrix sp.]